MKVKVYELTTNGKDGYIKYYVRGIHNDEEARKIAKAGFGEYYYWDSGISYYDDVESNSYEKGYWLKNSYTKQEFIHKMKKLYQIRK